MHQLDNNGDHIFTCERAMGTSVVLEEYVFECANFQVHAPKHSISSSRALAEIDLTIADPDLITSGPSSNKRGLYRVKDVLVNRDGRQILKLWRVHCFRKPSSNRYYIIATAFLADTSPDNAIHYLEQRVWAKPASKI